jgi:hypothetical protein
VPLHHNRRHVDRFSLFPLRSQPIPKIVEALSVDWRSYVAELSASCILATVHYLTERAVGLDYDKIQVQVGCRNFVSGRSWTRGWIETVRRLQCGLWPLHSIRWARYEPGPFAALRAD